MVPEVLAYDEERAWLLLDHAGTPIGMFGNPPEAWLAVLPRYAELQLSARWPDGVPEVHGAGVGLEGNDGA